MSTPFSRCVLLVLVLPLAWGTSRASAQQLDQLNHGDRLRLTSDGAAAFQGVLQARSVEGLTLSGDQGESVYVPYSTLLGIEKASGRNRGKGALIGGAFGFFVGAIAGVATSECVDCDDPYGVGGEGLIEASSAGTGAVLGGVLLGGAGAVLGAFVFAPLRWVEISVLP